MTKKYLKQAIKDQTGYEVKAVAYEENMKVQELKQWIREILASEDLLLDLGWSQTMHKRGLELLND